MYHLKLLQNNLPLVCKKQLDHLKELADILGYDHDITVLKLFLKEHKLYNQTGYYLTKEQKYLRDKAYKVDLV